MKVRELRLILSTVNPELDVMVIDGEENDIVPMIGVAQNNENSKDSTQIVLCCREEYEAFLN